MRTGTRKTRTTTRATASGALALRTSLTVEKLQRLLALVSDHLGIDPDTLNWGHVGSLCPIEELVSEALTHSESVADELSSAELAAR